MPESWIHRSCAKCGHEWDENDTRELLQCGCEMGETRCDIPSPWPIFQGVMISCAITILIMALCSGCAHNAPRCVNECDLGAAYQPDLPLCDSTNVETP